MAFSKNGSLFSMNELQQFIIDNSIVGTTAGVCIALVTKDLIASLVGDIIIPGIILLCITLVLN